MIFILLLVCNASCLSASDPAFEAVRRALQSEDADPEKAYEVVRDNLNKVKDRQIVSLLLDYLNRDSHRQTSYPALLGEIIFYLEKTSGVKSHIGFLIGDPVYMNRQEEDKDIAQWQAWWDANKDYIYRDEQTQSLKVQPH